MNDGFEVCLKINIFQNYQKHNNKTFKFDVKK